jgi:hypothetical protein
MSLDKTPDPGRPELGIEFVGLNADQQRFTFGRCPCAARPQCRSKEALPIELGRTVNTSQLSESCFSTTIFRPKSVAFVDAEEFGPNLLVAGSIMGVCE